MEQSELVVDNRDNQETDATRPPTPSKSLDEILSFIEAGSRVLLINPPVYERRYEWLRWNQPADLLRLGSYLKREKGCDVKLFDFMLPDEKGLVTRKLLRKGVVIPESGLTWAGAGGEGELEEKELLTGLELVESYLKPVEEDYSGGNESDIDPDSAIIEYGGGGTGLAGGELETGAAGANNPARWHFGRPFYHIDTYLSDPDSFPWLAKNVPRGKVAGKAGRARGRVWRPDLIWITSLTSYWWEPIEDLVGYLKNKLGQVRIVLAGNYPLYESEHARQRFELLIGNEGEDSLAKGTPWLVTDHLDLCKEQADFSLYHPKLLPQFCALDVNSPYLYEEIYTKRRQNVRHFAFFNDPLIGTEAFKRNVVPALQKLMWESVPDSLFKNSDSENETGENGKDGETGSRALVPSGFKPVSSSHQAFFRLHGICGIYPSHLQDEELGYFLRQAGFSEFHLEYEVDPATGRVALELYQKALRALGINSRTSNGPIEISAFVNIGRPDDDLKVIIQNMLDLLKVVPSIIPKPWSPAPGGEFFYDSPEKLSPHLMPCAGHNGVSLEDYADLYRLAAFLNYKVRGTTLDYTSRSYLLECIRAAFGEKRWQL